MTIRKSDSRSTRKKERTMIMTIVNTVFILVAVVAWSLARERENRYKESIVEVYALISKLSQELHRLKVTSREREDAM